MNCDDYGYKVGDRFKVIKYSGTFHVGSIIELSYDDTLSIPRFKLLKGGMDTHCAMPYENESYESLENIQKLESYECNSIDNNTDDATAIKFDSNKPMVSLIDPVWLEDVSKVLMFGAEKYSKHNWKGGFKYSRLLDAAYRHIGAFNNGEENDPESGLSHLDHAACCLMFLSWMVKNRPDLDDRYKQNESK